MIALLWPLGLIALAALAVPVLVHLLRRPQDRVVPFAAWQYIAEQVSFRERLQLRAWLLLALRLLLLAVLALLLAEPVWRAADAPAAPWIVVAPGIDPARVRAVAGAAGEAHWLQPGFPALTATPAANIDLTLLRELDARLPLMTALTVVVPAQLDGLDAVRLQLRRAVEWRIVPGELPPSPPAIASIAVRIGDDADHDAELRTVRALAGAWQAASAQNLQLDVGAPGRALPENLQLLFWFGGMPDAAAQGWLAQGGSLLQSQAADGAWPLHATSVGRGRRFAVADAFDVQAIPALADADQPQRLREQLLAPLRPPARAVAQAVAPEAGAAVSIETGRSLQPWLVLLAALLFAIERVGAAWQAGRRDD